MMHRFGVRTLLAPALLAGLVLAACQGQTPTGGQTGSAGSPGAATTTDSKNQPEIKLKVPETIQMQPAGGAKTEASPAAQSAGTAASPVAKTAASPVAATRGEPKGRVVYAWHTAVAPTWFDPQENPQLLTPYGWQYALHDALVKPMPGNVFTPSLAESYEIAPDFKSATFKLRPNLKFHNGDPVTSADVKWTYENYKGANATVLKEKTASVETPDDRTVKFNFKEAFPDFLILYGTPASGAGWIVPAKYYQQVGPDGFKQNPIGAGPYKLVKQSGGTEFEFEAFTDYWRKTPNVKTLIFRSIPENATRVAALQSGEVDIVNLIPGELVETVRSDPNIQLAPVRASGQWLELTGWEDPSSPFHDKRVREAMSLALDRKAMSEAEEAGLSGFEGNWIPEDWPGAIKRPMPEYNVERAKQLMAEAGYPNGFEVPQLTPLPPYNSFGERVITALREIGINTKLNSMERGAFISQLAEKKDGFGPGIILHLSASPGDAAARIRSYATCDGATSRTCDPYIDERMKQYDTSANPQERERLLTEVQEYMLDNHIFIPLYRQAFINAVGPRIANKWDEIIGAVPQYAYPGPYEDIQVKE